jgi:Mn-dependent DtxR family transcriptional regulator
MTLEKRIKNLLREKPYLSRSSVADELGASPSTISVVAHRHGIRFMDRKQVEELFDGKKK